MRWRRYFPVLTRLPNNVFQVRDFPAFRFPSTPISRRLAICVSLSVLTCRFMNKKCKLACNSAVSSIVFHDCEFEPHFLGIKSICICDFVLAFPLFSISTFVFSSRKYEPCGGRLRALAYATKIRKLSDIVCVVRGCESIQKTACCSFALLNVKRVVRARLNSRRPGL